MPEQRTSFSPLRSGLHGLFRHAASSAELVPAGSERPAQASREMLERRFAGLNHPEALLLAFADGLAGLGGELADMGLRLQVACAESDWSRGARLLRQLLDKYIRTIETGTALGDTRSSGERLRDLSVNLLDNLAVGLQPANLAEQAENLADGLRQWQPGLPLETLEQAMRLLDQQLQQTNHAVQEQHTLRLSLFALLLDNISQMLNPDSWLYAELQRVAPLLDTPADNTQLQQALQTLREASYQQGLLQQRLEQTTSALEYITPQLAGLWGEFALSPVGGHYLDRVRALPLALSQARNGNELIGLLGTLVKDTVQLQQQFTTLQGQSNQDQQALLQALGRLQALESRSPSRPASTDPVTGLPDASQLPAMVATLLQQMPVLNLGLLAIQGLQACQREQGRSAAAALQKQLAEELVPLLHNDEHLLRLPESLFVVLLPGASLLAAQDRLMSLRRELAGNALAPRLRASVMRWQQALTLDQHLDRLEAALPEDGGETAVELV